jgi:photosystem II stability/assembly factor-like uncharacterized protein
MKTPSLLSLCWTATGMLLAAGAPAIAQTWVQTQAPILDWTSVACSADGQRVYASSTGFIYASQDGGSTWNETTAPFGEWNSITCSADGRRIIVVGYDAFIGPVYQSQDFGATWETASISGEPWTSVSSSADGSVLIAASDYNISLSTDSGGTWDVVPAPVTASAWNAVAVSADGRRFVVGTGGHSSTLQPLFVSQDGGATWETASLPDSAWSYVAVSDDGTHMLAVSNYFPTGPVYLSKNAGDNWTKQAVPAAPYSVTAISADGMHLVIAADYVGGVGGVIRVSSNGGTSWINTNAPFLRWRGLAISADGRNALAVAYGGGIYRRQLTAPTVSAITRMEGGTARLELDATAGTRVEVLASENLSDWTLLGQATEATPGHFVFNDPDAAGHPARYYVAK